MEPFSSSAWDRRSTTWGCRSTNVTALDGLDHKLIDPDGLIAEPEYDLGVILREDPVELVAEADPFAVAHRLTSLASAHTELELDATAVWEWGVVERVSTGLMASKIDLQPIGGAMLQAADELAARHPT